jgi:hypothetical protein
MDRLLTAVQVMDLLEETEDQVAVVHKEIVLLEAQAHLGKEITEEFLVVLVETLVEVVEVLVLLVEMLQALILVVMVVMDHLLLSQVVQ